MTAAQELVSAIHLTISQKFQRPVDPTKNFRKLQIFTTLFRLSATTAIMGTENTGSGIIKGNANIWAWH